MDVLSHQHFLCHGQTTGVESMRCTTRMLLMAVTLYFVAFPPEGDENDA